MIINDLDDYYIVFDTKNRNIELDTLENRRKLINEISKNIIDAWQRCCGYRFTPKICIWALSNM